MFVKAIEKASQFTRPVIISNRYYDNSITSSLGSFIVINPEGWFITAAHIVNQTQQHQTHLREFKDYQEGKIPKPNPKWILNHSLWFGKDEHRVARYFLFPENDLALGKIENYNPDFVKEYPKFIAPEKVKPGRSLCRLGFPFYELKASFENNAFRYPSNLFPIPMFPSEGMMTRVISGGKGNSIQLDIIWLETGSPGLRGQSGGPIFDTEGNIWAMQSQTRHIPLGFSPKIKKDGVEIEENQFINLGWGVHVKSITDFLNYHNVDYRSSGLMI